MELTITSPPEISTISKTKTGEYKKAIATLPKNIKLKFFDTNGDKKLSPTEWLEYTTNGNRVVLYNPHAKDTPEIVAQRTSVPIDVIKANWRLKDSTRRDPNAFLTLTCGNNTKPPQTTPKTNKTSKYKAPFTQNQNAQHSDNFYNALAYKESTYNQNAKNGQYMGWFQLGKPALIEAGYMDKNGKYTGKDGIKSEADFLANGEAQKNAVKLYHQALARQIKAHNLQDYIGKTINGIPITEASLIAGAHLVGTKGLKTFLKSNGKIIPKDKNNTPITEYMKNYGSYNLPELSPLMKRKPDSEIPATHVLQKGEYISSIAKLYDRQTSKILALNGLTEETAKGLRIGQEIKLK